MHELFTQVLAKRDLSRAGDLFSVNDNVIVEDLTEVLNEITQIASLPDYGQNSNDQSVVEICITRVTSCLRETDSAERHCQALVSLLESCLHHSLRPSTKDQDPPHAKIAADVIASVFLNYSKRTVMEVALPVAVKFLHKGNKELSRNLARYLSLAAIEHASLLSPHVQPVLDSIISGNYPLCRVLAQIFQVSPEPLGNHTMALVALLPHCDVQEQLHLMNLFSLIAKDTPMLLEASVPQLCEYLSPPTTSAATMQVLVGLAERRPALLADHVAGVRAAADKNPALVCLAARIIAAVGKLSKDKAQEALNFVLEHLPKADRGSQTTLLREATLLCSSYPVLFTDKMLSSVRQRNMNNNNNNNSNATNINALSSANKSTNQENHTSVGVTIVKLTGHTGPSIQISNPGYTRRSKLGDSRSTGRLHAGGNTHRSATRLNNLSSGGSVGGLHSSVSSQQINMATIFSSVVQHQHGGSHGALLTHPTNTSIFVNSQNAEHNLPSTANIRNLNSPVFSTSGNSTSFVNSNTQSNNSGNTACGTANSINNNISSATITASNTTYQTNNNGIHIDTSPAFAIGSSGGQILSPFAVTTWSNSAGNLHATPVPPLSNSVIVTGHNKWGIPNTSQHSTNKVQSGGVTVTTSVSPPSLPLRSIINNTNALVVGVNYGSSPLSITMPNHVIPKINNRSITLLNANSDVNKRMSVFEPFPMRDTVQHFCEKHLEKIKAYMDNMFSMIPLPAKCTIEERRAKKLVKLHFTCQTRGEHCLYSRTFFIMKTRNPKIWIHLMFIALQARSENALSSRDASVSSLKHCWDTLKCENRTFVTLVTSAFPCAKDQEILLNELRQSGYFDVFDLATCVTNQQGGGSNSATIGELININNQMSTTQDLPELLNKIDLNKIKDDRHLPTNKHINKVELKPNTLLQWGCLLCNHPEKAMGFLRGNTQPVIEGKLKEKKGKWRLFRRWRTRYFTLSGAHLSCKGSSGGESIEINQIRSVKVSRGGVRNIPKAFEIFTGNQTLILKPEDGKNAEKWVQCLSIALAHSHALDCGPVLGQNHQLNVKTNSLPARVITTNADVITSGGSNSLDRSIV